MYQVGQKIRVRPDLSIDFYSNGHFVVKEMLEFAGRVCHILHLKVGYKNKVYYLKETDYVWAWPEDWLLPEKPNNEEVVKCIDTK